MAKKINCYPIEIMVNGVKYNGDVEVEGTRILYPTVLYGIKSKRGNSFKPSQFESMMEYCKVILNELI